MPRKSRRGPIKPGKRSRKRDSRPNVYIAPTEDGTEEDGRGASPVTAETAVTAASPARRVRRAATPRVRSLHGRQSQLRSAIFTQHLPQELKKLGLLTVGLAIVLGVLTVTLR